MEAQRRVKLLKQFRELGFYADLKDKSDGDVLAEINQRCRKVYKDDLTMGWDDGLAKNRMLHWDSQRFWQMVGGGSILPARKPYTQTLEQWASISLGAFKPEAIEESWEFADDGTGKPKEAKRVVVSFTCNGKRHELEPKIRDNRLDLDILVPINGLIVKTGRQFYVDHLSSLAADVLCLTRDEVDGLARKVDWFFSTPGDPIDSIVRKLNAKRTGWEKAEAPSVTLPADAKPESVVSHVIQLSRFGTDAGPVRMKTSRVLEIRSVMLSALGTGSSYAAVVESDLGLKVLIFRYQGPRQGWWTRFFEAFDMPAEKYKATFDPRDLPPEECRPVTSKEKR